MDNTFVADLHIHSHFSRATAKNLDLPHLEVWARRKGIAVVGTGDFTHPGWLAEIKDQLRLGPGGLFSLNPKCRIDTPADHHYVPQSPVQFLLSAEISSIYKQDGKTRKVHSLILMPDIDAVERFNATLDKIGNLKSDGRPILGLSAKDLLDITVNTDDRAMFIPAHAWTPWFSILGAHSGFDSLEECFGDLTPFVTAIETGLSSDPAMNWQLSMLDRVTLISNSDAHSPANLAREANLFNCPAGYDDITLAIKTGQGFEGTIEFFPEEGKYHLDGHRKCGLRLTPAERLENGDQCPKCGKKITIGVLSRVRELADRPQGYRPRGASDYQSLLPLPELIGQVLERGPKTKGVAVVYHRLIKNLGPELSILLEAGLDDVALAGGEPGPLISRAIDNMRRGRVHARPGFDGQYGVIEVVTQADRDEIMGQQLMWHSAKRPVKKSQKKADLKPGPKIAEDTPASQSGQSAEKLNDRQLAAVSAPPGPSIIVAGPGSGKTLALTRRIAYVIARFGARPDEVLAITFTRQAASEMKRRLERLLPDQGDAPFVSTFHALGAHILKMAGIERQVIEADDQMGLFRRAAKKVELTPAELARQISMAKQNLRRPEEIDEPKTARGYAAYQEFLGVVGKCDFDDLIMDAVGILRRDENLLASCRNRWPHVFIDEFQDINLAQWEFTRLLAPGGSPNLTAIGDPDQAIYGFRGATPQFFRQFTQNIPTARSVSRVCVCSPRAALRSASHRFARSSTSRAPRVHASASSLESSSGLSASIAFAALSPAVRRSSTAGSSSGSSARSPDMSLSGSSDGPPDTKSHRSSNVIGRCDLVSGSKFMGSVCENVSTHGLSPSTASATCSAERRAAGHQTRSAISRSSGISPSSLAWNRNPRCPARVVSRSAPRTAQHVSSAPRAPKRRAAFSHTRWFARCRGRSGAEKLLPENSVPGAAITSKPWSRRYGRYGHW